MRKRPYGVSLAWLVVILVIPFLGGFFYLLLGENRLPERRTERAKTSYNTYLSWLKTLQERAPVSWDELNPECFPLHRQAETLVGIPTMAGNNLTLITHPEEILQYHYRSNPQRDLHLPSAVLHLAGGRQSG